MSSIYIRGFNGAVFRGGGLIDTHNDPNLVVFKDLIRDLNKRGHKVHFFEELKKTAGHTNLYFFDFPYSRSITENITILKQLISKKNKKNLFCFEPPIVAPQNYFKFLHIFFDKIFTWNDDWVDNKKYFKFYWPQSNFGLHTKPIPFKQKKLLILINGNKLPITFFKFLSVFGHELYSERIKAIEFFEKKLANKFDLYGRGWNRSRLLDIHDFLFGPTHYKTYKGEIDNKIALLSKYKYCICFENVTNIKGFITEKIFDCFKARCVPIYWGATNINSYIPSNCYIDFKKFNSYQKLVTYLESINEKEYNQYISNINKLLMNKSFKRRWFGNEFRSNFL